MNCLKYSVLTGSQFVNTAIISPSFPPAGSGGVGFGKGYKRGVAIREKLFFFFRLIYDPIRDPVQSWFCQRPGVVFFTVVWKPRYRLILIFFFCL